jgi:hypothetical protein
VTNTKRNFFVLGGLGALFLSGAFLQSRDSQAKGAVSAAVQVMNTTSAPAITVDAEKLARIPYQSKASSSNCAAGVGTCQLSFTPAPAGYRLVAQHITAFYWLAPGTTQPPFLYLEDASLNTLAAAPATIVSGYDGAIVMAVLNQDIQMFFDSSDGGLVSVNSGNFAGPGFPETVTLTGYLENCSITGCPAIQR